MKQMDFEKDILGFIFIEFLTQSIGSSGLIYNITSVSFIKDNTAHFA